MTEDDFGDVDPIVGGVRWRSLTRSEYHVSPTYAVHPLRRERDGDPPRERGFTGQTVRKGGRSPSDLTELHGISEESLSVSVREVLLELIEESGHLHDQLLDAEHRIDFLQEQGRRDRLGGWLSTAALLGQIRHLGDLDQRESMSSSIAGFDLAGFDDLVRQKSWMVAQKAQIKIGTVLSSAAPSGDVVGRLGDGCFGILLPGVQVKEAAVLVAALADACASLQADGVDPAWPLTVNTAVVAIQPGQDAEETVSGLYRLLRR